MNNQIIPTRIAAELTTYVEKTKNADTDEDNAH
jgi:hypothetical protein